MKYNIVTMVDGETVLNTLLALSVAGGVFITVALSFKSTPGWLFAPLVACVAVAVICYALTEPPEEEA